MKLGGYQIIDLEDKNLVTGESVQYEGLYDKIEATRKPVMLCGITIDGKEYHNTYTAFYVDGSNFTATIYDKTITISDNDVVTITE